MATGPTIGGLNRDGIIALMTKRHAARVHEGMRYENYLAQAVVAMFETVADVLIEASRKPENGE